MSDIPEINNVVITQENSDNNLFSKNEVVYIKRQLVEMNDERWTEDGKVFFIKTLGHIAQGEALNPSQLYMYLSATTYTTTSEILSQESFLKNSRSNEIYEKMTSLLGSPKEFLNQESANLPTDTPFNLWDATYLNHLDGGLNGGKVFLTGFREIVIEQIKDLESGMSNKIRKYTLTSLKATLRQINNSLGIENE